jgi:hypothetical protein
MSYIVETYILPMRVISLSKSLFVTLPSPPNPYRFLVILFAFCSWLFADTIHLKKGDVIENVKVMEITQTDIKYKIGKREVVYTISKDDVLKVLHSDGFEEIFAEKEELQLEQREKIVETKDDLSNVSPKEKMIPSSGFRLGTVRFKPGIELNYPVWHSKMDFFDNSSYPGGGLFLRMWPAGSSEFIYFTTGAYFSYEALYKKAANNLSALGMGIATLPFLDLEYNRIFVEIPLLLNFGNGQIKFTVGFLLDFCVDSYFDMYISKDIPIIGGRSIYDIIREQYTDEYVPIIIGNTSISAIDIYDIDSIRQEANGREYESFLVLGLDMDIVEYWGVGVKLLIRGTPDQSLTELSRFQTRISTYFIF